MMSLCCFERIPEVGNYLDIYGFIVMEAGMSKDILPASGKGLCEPHSCCRSKTGKSAYVPKKRKQRLPFKREQALVKTKPIAMITALIHFFPPELDFMTESHLKIPIFYIFALSFKLVTSELWEIYSKYSRWGNMGNLESSGKEGPYLHHQVLKASHYLM